VTEGQAIALFYSNNFINFVQSALTRGVSKYKKIIGKKTWVSFQHCVRAIIIGKMTVRFDQTCYYILF
jgi:hypothetical protein